MAVLRCYATNRAAVSSALSRRSRRHARSVVHAASTTQAPTQQSELELALQQLDKHLSAVRAEGDDAESIESERLAITLAAQLREQQQLRGYGSGKLAPKRDYTLADLRLNKIEPEQLLSPRDVTLEGVRNMAILALALGVAAAATALHPSTEQLLAGGVALAFLAGIDQVGNNGALESVAVDALGRVVSPTYSTRVARHEAGHFLIAYLCGILPRAYTLSALDAFRRYRAGNVQAGTLFCDAAFRSEVASGRLTASSLDAFTCIALAGVASEYLAFGQAEGGVDDVRTLDSLLSACGFTQKRTDSEVRFAVLSVILLLKRQKAAHDALAEAMRQGRSVGDCILEIERAFVAE